MNGNEEMVDEASDAPVLLSIEGHVAQITINRPAVLNALNTETLDTLEEMLDRLAEDEAVRAVVLTGAGEKAFVAGADIKEIGDLDAEGGVAFCRRGQQLYTKIEQHPKIIIAAVNGFALGGGCELAMACDIRIAARNARFGQPEINLGVIPGYGGTQRLPRLIGFSCAKLLMLTGDMIDAEEARDLRLVNRVVPEGSALKEATDLARAIAGKAPRAVAGIKRTVEAAAGDEATGYQIEAEIFGSLMETHDKAEGIGAFLEKRSPSWKGE
jgi:enoyl-CoA hydratase